MKLLIEYQYFGNIILFKNLVKTNNIIFESCENYQKSSFRNKMVLAAPQGRQCLGVPILGGRGVKRKIDEVEIDYKENWQLNHIKTITNLYNRSPWFEFYKHDLENLYNKKIIRLVDWNLECFNWVCSKLKINANMSFTTNYQLEYPTTEVIDLRSATGSKKLEFGKSEPVYNQVFQDKIGFLENICILDLLFCEGPNALNVLSGK